MSLTDTPRSTIRVASSVMLRRGSLEPKTKHCHDNNDNGDLHAADVHRGKKFSRDTLPAIATPLQHWRFPVPGAGEMAVAALALPHAAALPG